MGRPAKAVSTMSKHLTKAEKDKRIENENKIKGNSDKILPPSYLSAPQKKIFKYIVAELKNSGILSNLDIYILSTCCIAIDRLQHIETLINSNNQLITDKELMSAKDKYTNLHSTKVRLKLLEINFSNARCTDLHSTKVRLKLYCQKFLNWNMQHLHSTKVRLKLRYQAQQKHCYQDLHSTKVRLKCYASN